jgi:transposase-like protein
MRAELPSFHHDAESRARAVINAGVMELARAYLDRARFPTSLERRAWRLFASEGATVREIAEQLGTAKSHIGRILLRHKRKAGIP